MTRRITTLLVAAALAGWSAWLALVLYVPPEPAWTRILFLALSLLAISTTGTLTAWQLGNRGRFPHDDLPSVGPAVFQGAGLGVAATIALGLQVERMLSPLHIVLLVSGYWLLNILLWSGRSPR